MKEIFSLNLLTPLELKDLQKVSKRCLTHIKKFFVFSEFSIKDIFSNFSTNFGFPPYLKLTTQGEQTHIEENPEIIESKISKFIEDQNHNIGLIAFFSDFQKVIMSIEFSWIMKTKGKFDLFMIIKSEELEILVELLRFKQDRNILRSLFGLKMMTELN